MTEETKRVLVYHDTQQQANRARKPANGETVGYAAIADFDPAVNETFDEVIDLSTKPNPKNTVKKGKGNDV